MRFDDWASAQVGAQCTVIGTVNYTVQQTMQDPNNPTNPVTPYAANFVVSGDSNAVAATGNIQTFFPYAPAYAKVTLNSGTGSVTATFTQYGVNPI